MITREMRFKKDFSLEKIEDIKLKELRIGNFVYCLSDDEKTLEFVEISEIHEDMVYFTQCNFDGTIGGLCYPIPLTEEWLFKFGFEISDDSYSDLSGEKKSTYQEAFIGDNPITKDYLIILKNTGNGWFYRNGYFNIEYVHELQNLYFALTKQELTISK